MRGALQSKIARGLAAMLFAASCASAPFVHDRGERAKGVAASDARECKPSFHFINPAGRTNYDLSGTWRIIPDPVREGLRSDVGAQYAMFRDESDATIPPHRLKEYDFAAATTIEVPGSWSRMGASLEWYDGLVWYQREFKMKRSPSRRYFLYFGAANYEANVFLNGERAGVHSGGFTPFDFEVTHLLKEGGNSLVVAVDSAHGAKSVPTARTDWWNYGGVSRPPLIVETPETFIADYWVRLDGNGRIAADISFDGKDAAGKPASIHIAELGLSIDLVADGAGGPISALLANCSGADRDALAAGFIYGLLTGESAEESLKLGWAHGALLTTFPGDTTMATVEQVRAFAKGGSARIQR